MRRWLLAGLSVVVLSVLVGSAAPARAAFAGRNGRIVFVLLRFGAASATSNIASMRPDGSGIRLLTHNGANSGSFGASVAQSGRLIAFDKSTPNGTQIWIMRLNGSHKRQVTRGRYASNTAPSWSPNGRWIAYTHSGLTSTNTQIWEVHPDGSDAHHLIHTAYNDDLAQFAPREHRILFTETLGPNASTVSLATAQGSHVHQIAAIRHLDGFAGEWSPNGRQIVFSNNATRGRSSLYTIWRNGSHLVRVTTPGSHEYNDIFPTWSPDGQWIAFMRSPCPQANSCAFDHVAIDLVHPNGVGVHAVTHKSQVIEYLNPDWGRRPHH